MTVMTDIEEIQVRMHTDFFERCKFAIQNGFYLEAIIMEYAAIESRLEVICGVFGFPCGKDCECRKDIMISSRIECLRKYRCNNATIFANSKLPSNFFTEKGLLKKWIDKRNRIVHGLYKDEIKYRGRIQESEAIANKGLKYTRLLYNEVKRVRRMKKNYPLIFENGVVACENTKCKAYIEGE